MDAKGFRQDLTQKSALLRRLAEHNFDWSAVTTDEILLLGMGSSHFANDTVARFINRGSLTTRALLASSASLPALASESTVITVSAGGSSVESLHALNLVPTGVTTVALTNRVDSAIALKSDAVVDLAAGTEAGGVACLTYVATLIALLRLAEGRSSIGFSSEDILKAATAIDHIIATSDEWLPQLEKLAIGASTTYFAAPLERLCSAQQSALMLREGPRHAAAASEVGDWSHIDVYLTKTYDYRLIVFAGSDWQAQMLEWTTQRGSTVISIGADCEGAALSLRYPHDDNDWVRLLAETTYAELLAAHMWLKQA